jgi:predicted ester cyclase
MEAPYTEQIDLGSRKRENVIMGTEITEGGQALLDAMQKLVQGDAEAAFDPGFTDRDPAPGQPPGSAGLAWFWAGFEESFSDVKREIIETVATAGHVVTVMNLSGRHTGRFMGHEPTDRTFTVRNVQVARFANGRMIERWGSTDQLGILQQLGLA